MTTIPWLEEDEGEELQKLRDKVAEAKAALGQACDFMDRFSSDGAELAEKLQEVRDGLD